MRFVVIFCFLFIGACKSKTAVPEGIIPVKQMTNILWDVMLADELVAMHYPVDTAGKRLDTSIVLYSQIAKAHQTNQQAFKKSMRYYQSRPDLLQVILDSLYQRATVPLLALPKTKDSLVAR